MKKSLLMLFCLSLLGASSSMAMPLSVHKGINANRISIADNSLVFKNDKVSPFNHTRKSPLKAASELSMNWGYCSDPYSALPMPKGILKGAIMMTKETATKFAGSEISAIQVANPTNRNYANPFKGKELTVWISEDLDGEPVCSTTGKFGPNGFEYTSVELEEPYIIKADTPVYIGYTFNVTQTANVYSLIIDAVEPVNEYSAFVYSTASVLGDKGWSEDEEPSWKAMGEQISNICLTASISGDNLPTNEAQIPGYLIPSVVKTNSDFDLVFLTLNKAANTISDVDVTFNIAGQEAQVKNVKLYYGPIAYNEMSRDTVSFVCQSVGDIYYDFHISAINGVSVDNSNVVSGQFLSVENGFNRNVVIEEATGTWCGYCVRGYAGMEYMREHYADKGFLGIALHSNDEMDVLGAKGAYSSFLKYIPGYPSAFTDRDWNNSFDPSPEVFENEFLSMVSMPALAQITAELEVGEDPRNVTLKTKSMFVLSNSNANYGVAYTVVEDNVGPYVQQNYYAGGQLGDCYGFEKEPAAVPLIYNDVARNCSHPIPFANSVPSSTEPNTEYDYSTNITLSDVSDLNNYRVIAMLIDNNTGMIMNACQAIPGEAGVEEIFDASTLRVIGGKGMLVVNGEAANVYSVDGKMVASKVDGAVSLPAGLYIVNAKNRSVKVIVR